MFRHTRKTLALSVLTLGISHANASGLDAQLDSVFNDMANVTPPGVYESQRRGVIAGGRITAKARIMNESLVNVQTPSFKGGCGGIDMFGGSFSFINADQLVQLFRTVAANAKGYAFQMAIKAMSPDISDEMKNMQAIIQKMNNLSANSCQLAQGLVNDTMSAFGKKGQTDASLTGTAKGLFADTFSGMFGGGGTDQAKQLETATAADPEAQKKLYGNIVWKAMKKHGVEGWFSGGDDTMLQAMMSLTGTLIITTPVADTAIPNSSGSQPVAKASTLSLAQLVEGSTDGGEFKVWRCASNDLVLCLNPTLTSVTFQGYLSRLKEHLLDPSTGVIQKLRHPELGAQLTNAQKNIMANLPSGVGTMIRNMAARAGGTGATQFVDDSLKAIAVHMAYDFAITNIEAVHISVTNSMSSHRKPALEMVNDARSRIKDEYSQIRQETGSISDIAKYYMDMMAMAPRVQIATKSSRGGL